MFSFDFFSFDTLVNFAPQMRVAVFLISVCFYLLGGVHYIYADSHNGHTLNSIAFNLTKNEEAKFTNITHGNTIIIESTDLDLDEEFSNSDDVKGVSNKFFTGKYNLLSKWNLTHSGQFVLNHYYCTFFKIFPPYCGYSSPIYITQRALRI